MFIWTPVIAFMFYPLSWIVKAIMKKVWIVYSPKKDRLNEKRCEKFCILGYKLSHHVILTILMWNVRQYKWFHDSDLMVDRLFVEIEYPFYYRLIMLVHCSRYCYLTFDILLDVLVWKTSKFTDSDFIEMFIHHVMSLNGFLEGYNWYFYETILRFYLSIVISDAALSAGRMAMMLEWKLCTKILIPVAALAWISRCLVITNEVYLTQMALFGDKYEHLDFVMGTMILQQWVLGVILQWMWLYRIIIGGIRVVSGRKINKRHDRNV